MLGRNSRTIEAPRRKRRGTILTSTASNLRPFFCLLFLCSLTPQQATGNRVYELGEANRVYEFGEANTLAGFNYANLDAFVIMPDHIHGIIMIISLEMKNHSKILQNIF